jgi:hypothetical protein
MTRKHFEGLAIAMAHVRPEPDTAGVADRVAWSEAVGAVAATCRAGDRSAGFDNDRFWDACTTWDTEIRNGRLSKVVS